MDDPVLQLDQLGLQAEQLVEIGAAVDRGLVPEGGDLTQLAQDALVVDLHLELFVEGVGELGLDPALLLRPLRIRAHRDLRVLPSSLPPA